MPLLSFAYIIAVSSFIVLTPNIAVFGLCHYCIQLATYSLVDWILTRYITHSQTLWLSRIRHHSAVLLKTFVTLNADGDVILDSVRCIHTRMLQWTANGGSQKQVQDLNV